MNEFTVITPTGDRPEAFEICCKMMEKQTIKPTKWLIIDDGDVNIKIPNWSFIQYIKRERKETGHTLPYQMKEAIKYVQTDKVVMMEDDDWYDKTYLETMDNLLNTYDIAGQINSVYYRIPDKTWFMHNNTQNCSLCQTGFTNKLFYIIEKYSGKRPYIDLELWKHKNKILLNNSFYLCIGIKGLPGRKGVSAGHTKHPKFNTDSNLEKLKNLIHDDINFYLKYVEI